MRYACIAQHRAEYPIRLMCRVLAVSRAGFYAAWRKHSERRTTEKHLPRLPYTERSGPSPTDDTPPVQGVRSFPSWTTSSNAVSIKSGQFQFEVLQAWVHLLGCSSSFRASANGGASGLRLLLGRCC